MFIKRTFPGFPQHNDPIVTVNFKNRFLTNQTFRNLLAIGVNALGRNNSADQLFIWVNSGSAQFAMASTSTASRCVFAVDNAGNLQITPGNNQTTINGTTVTTLQGAVTNLSVNNQVSNNSNGLKHIRLSTGVVAAGATALVTVTWTNAFATANYTVVASVVDATAAVASMSIVHIEAVNTTDVKIRVVNNSAGNITGTLHVIAMLG